MTNDDKVLTAIREHGGSLTPQDVSTLLRFSWHGADRLLRRMVARGVLRIDKRADATWFELAHSDGNEDAQLIQQLAAILGPEVEVELAPDELRARVTAYPALPAAQLIIRCQLLIRALMGATGILFQFAGRRGGRALLQRCSLAFVRVAPILSDEEYQTGYLAGNTR